MKQRVTKKIITLLLSTAIVFGMNGAAVSGADQDQTGIEGSIIERTTECAFTVTMDNKKTAYENITDMAGVWKSVQGKTAVIHLMKDMDASQIIFEGAPNTDDDRHTFYLESGNITLEMEKGVKLFNTGQDQIMGIKGGTFTLESGEICSEIDSGIGKSGSALVVNGGSVYIKKGTTISGNVGISVSGVGNPVVQISGGTFVGTEYAVACADGLQIDDLLAEGYAFKDSSGKWITGTDLQKDKFDSGSFTVRGYPMEFTENPVSWTGVYGSAMPVLSAKAVKTDESVAQGDITYKWFQSTDNGYVEVAGVEAVGVEGTQYILPEFLRAGSYQYYCQAASSGAGGSEHTNKSDTAVVTVEPKTITAVVEGTADKEYDGTTNVPPGLSIRLEGIVNADQVTASALSWAYDSAEAGSRMITATGITIGGKDAGNYQLASNSASVSGRIRKTDSGTDTDNNTGGSYVIYREPFVKGHPDRRGWYMILLETEKAVSAPGGGAVDIDMNGTSFVDDRIFKAIRGSDVAVAFDMGRGILWTVCGKDITAQTAEYTNFSVRTDQGNIPQEIIEDTAGGRAYLELNPVHKGIFGFTAVLTITIGSSRNGIAVSGGTAEKYAGMYANLFSYDPVHGSLEFVCAGLISEDGTADLPVAFASDYAVILSEDPMDTADMPEPSEPQEGTEQEHPQDTKEDAQVKSVTLSKTVCTYSGKAKKPSVIAADTDGRLIDSRYYTVAYKNNKKVGKASAVVTFKDGYSGTAELTFTIRPAGTSIKKTTASSGGFRIQWAKKTAQTSGYQIQYSADSEFKGKNTRSIFIKNSSKTKKNVKNIKAGKKYYVRIRTYKNVQEGGTRIYSAWSRAVKAAALPKD